MSRYNLAVVHGAPNTPTGVCLTEFTDTPDTYRGRPREAAREVVFIRETDPGVTLDQTVRDVARMAAEQGPGVRVYFTTDGQLDTAQRYAAAASDGLFELRPRGVTIVSGRGVTADGLGYCRVGDAELISSLREHVRENFRRRNAGEETLVTLPATDATEQIIKTALTMPVEVGPAGALKFPQRKDEAAVFALALALYPPLHPSKSGRRYRFWHPGTSTPDRPRPRGFVTEASYGVAVEKYGQLAVAASRPDIRSLRAEVEA